MERLLKRSHKYYTQCMLQMSISGTIKNYFVGWTSYETIVDKIYFDNEFYCSLKNKFQK